MNEKISRLAIGSNRKYSELKNLIKTHLIERGQRVDDLSDYSQYVSGSDQYAGVAASGVAHGLFDAAILIGTNGNDEAISANRHEKIRCAICWNPKIARIAKEEFDANIIAIGAGTLGISSAVEIIDSWLNAEFKGGIHARRIEQIDRLWVKRLIDQGLRNRIAMLDGELAWLTRTDRAEPLLVSVSDDGLEDDRYVYFDCVDPKSLLPGGPRRSLPFRLIMRLEPFFPS